MPRAYEPRLAKLLMTMNANQMETDAGEAFIVEPNLGMPTRLIYTQPKPERVARAAVRLAVDGDRADAELLAGTDDADRDLAPVGDEHGVEHVEPSRFAWVTVAPPGTTWRAGPHRRRAAEAPSNLPLAGWPADPEAWLRAAGLDVLPASMFFEPAFSTQGFSK